MHQESHDCSKNDQHEGYISQPNSPNISKVVEPLKRKAPLSEYWLNYPRASSSAHADVKVTISEKVIALWKGDNTDKTSIEVSIEDADLHEFGKFLSSKLLYYHPLIPFSKATAALETKKKLLSHARIVMGNLITNADYHVSSHKDFFYDFDKHYIRPIQLQHQTIISMVKDIRASLLPKTLQPVCRGKIISAPIKSASIWNIPPECEKALEDLKRNRNRFFRERRTKFRSSPRGRRFSKGSFRGSKPLTKKASSSRPTSK